jgi:hypothetical protein
MMQTKTINGVTMTLKAACYWGELCDVGIVQEWKNTQQGNKLVFVEMTAAEAEALIVEMQAAIVEARRIDAEYAAHMEREQARVYLPDGLEGEF